MGVPGPTEFLILLFLLVTGGAVLLFLTGRRRSSDSPTGPESRDAQQVLDERYAKGDIGREEYRQMRQDIEG